MKDDGIQRGGVFLLIGAYIKRQFEFIQSQWVTDGDFIRQGREQDPIIGNNQGDGIFTIPQHPIRRRLHGLPRFVTGTRWGILLHAWVKSFEVVGCAG